MAGQVLEGRPLGAQLRFEGQDPPADPQPGLDDLRRERLDHVVVGSRLEPGEDVAHRILAGEEQDVGVASLVRPLAQAPADLGAVEAGHHPVEHRETRCVGGLQDAPGGLAVGDRHHLVSGPLEGPPQDLPRDRLIVGNQDALGHVRPAGQIPPGCSQREIG